MGRVLLANEQGGPLAQLTVTSKQTPLQQTLGSIVVHTAAVLLCRQGVGLLKPFVNMLCNPTALVVSIWYWQHFHCTENIRVCQCIKYVHTTALSDPQKPPKHQICCLTHECKTNGCRTVDTQLYFVHYNTWLPYFITYEYHFENCSCCIR